LQPSAPAIRDRRDGVVLAPKFGNWRGEGGSFKGVRGDAESVRGRVFTSQLRRKFRHGLDNCHHSYKFRYSRALDSCRGRDAVAAEA
jgi:hypothetical protein